MTYVFEWTQRLRREYTDKLAISGKCIYLIVQKMMRCSKRVRKKVRCTRRSDITSWKRKKNRINRKKTRKKKGRKKQKGEENWKEEKGEGESVELYFFFFLVSTFLSWPLKRKVENTEWKTEAEIGKRATALFARLPNDFERKLPKLLIGYLVKVDNIIIANIYYEYLFIR